MKKFISAYRMERNGPLKGWKEIFSDGEVKQVDIDLLCELQHCDSLTNGIRNIGDQGPVETLAFGFN